MTRRLQGNLMDKSALSASAKAKSKDKAKPKPKAKGKNINPDDPATLAVEDTHQAAALKAAQEEQQRALLQVTWLPDNAATQRRKIQTYIP